MRDRSDLKRIFAIPIWHDFEVQIAECQDDSLSWRLSIENHVFDISSEEVERLREAFTYGVNSERAKVTAIHPTTS